MWPADLDSGLAPRTGAPAAWPDEDHRAVRMYLSSREIRVCRAELYLVSQCTFAHDQLVLGPRWMRQSIVCFGHGGRGGVARATRSVGAAPVAARDRGRSLGEIGRRRDAFILPAGNYISFSFPAQSWLIDFRGLAWRIHASLPCISRGFVRCREILLLTTW